MLRQVAAKFGTQSIPVLGFAVRGATRLLGYIGPRWQETF
jgi:hypothetical protein